MVHHCPLAFLQDLVENKKTIFLEADTRYIVVPKWPEFAIHKIWPQAMKNKRFRDAMPSSWGSGHRAPERDYVFKVLATVEFDWLWGNVQRIISEREKRRMVERP